VSFADGLPGLVGKQSRNEVLYKCMFFLEAFVFPINIIPPWCVWDLSGVVSCSCLAMLAASSGIVGALC
jgi:hypothetical protein